MSEKHDGDSHYKELSGAEGQKKISELVKDIRIAEGFEVHSAEGHCDDKQ